MNHWYVVQTKPKKEKEVVNRLQGAGYESFCPQLKGPQALKPLFPSYLFVQADFSDPYHLRMVKFARGVRHVLGNHESPIALAEGIVAMLMEKTRDGCLIEQELLFKVGEVVRVKKGILKDLQGIIEKNLPAKGRIQILLKWMNVSLRAQLKPLELELAA